jgi:hypothetical protein
MEKLKHPAWGQNENKTHSKHNKAVIYPSILVVTCISSVSFISLFLQDLGVLTVVLLKIQNSSDMLHCVDW